MKKGNRDRKIERTPPKIVPGTCKEQRIKHILKRFRQRFLKENTQIGDRAKESVSERDRDR